MFTDVSEVPAASTTKATMEAATASETSVNLYQTTNGATTQKTAIFFMMESDKFH
jgi:hypothetical protein